MISHVWTPSSFWDPPFPLIPGNGGTETFTLGQCRELNRRGIPNQIITFGLGKNDGRKLSPDITFVDYPTPADMGLLEGDAILATEPARFRSKKPSYVMMHNQPLVERNKQFYKRGYAGHRLITNSHASAKGWAEYLGIKQRSIGIVYPFADAIFGKVAEPSRKPGPTRVLFAGRLTAEKGIYTFLEMLHFFNKDKAFEFTVVLAGKQDTEYPIIEKLIKAHPMIKTVPMQTNNRKMAALLVEQDVVVMPSQSKMWREPFGILSVEAQHAGCRVVASDIGGLPETDCGGLHVFEADNPVAFAKTLRKAAALGRLTTAERKVASRQLTVEQSVDQLLAILAADNLPVYKP